MHPKKPLLGQGYLIDPEAPPQLREFGPDEKVAISGMIKWYSDVRNADPSLVTERDIGMLQPVYIETGLYVPEGVHEKDVTQAKGGVIFPASEYSFLTVSPKRLAESAATGVRKNRSQNPDKSRVEDIAGKASAHALKSQIDRSQQLFGALEQKQNALKTIRKELMGAKGTGFFAHYPANDVRMIVINGETAIFEALEVCATTKNWNLDQLKRAKDTLHYKLYGDHKERFKNWKEFSLMAYQYTRRRKLVVMSNTQKLQREFSKYEHYLDEE